jgi:hypothetical protein
MKTWLRRIRGAMGMGLTWGAAWFGAGILLARVPGFHSDLPFPLLFAPLGFVSGIIFSGIITAIGSGRRYVHLSLPRFAAWGAAGGLLLSGVFAVAAAVGGRSAWGEVLAFGPALAMAGALSAAGSLAVARRAETRELPGPSGDPAKADLTADQRPALPDGGD